MKYFIWGTASHRTPQEQCYRGILFSTSHDGTTPIGLSSIERASLTGSEDDDVLDASPFSGLADLFGRGGNDLLVASKGTLIAGPFDAGKSDAL